MTRSFVITFLKHLINVPVGDGHLQLGHRVLVAVIIFAIAINSTLPQASAAPLNTSAAHVSAQEADDSFLPECDDIDQATLRDELNRVSQDMVSDDGNSINISAIVVRQWQALEMDQVVDQVVDDAVDTVRADTTWWNLLPSGWSPSLAEEMAQKVAETAFGSPEFEAGVQELSQSVAIEVSLKLAELSAGVSAFTTICLRQFIVYHYAPTVLEAFQLELERSILEAEHSVESSVDESLLNVISRHQAALGAIGVVVASYLARRIVAKIAKDFSVRIAGRIGTRILGRVGSSVIPIAGWIVGIGLLTYDIMETRDGALPQIRTQLQSVEIKSEIRSEIASSIEEELDALLPSVTRDISNDLFNLWQAFRRKYRRVLDLASNYPLLLQQGLDIVYLSDVVDMVDRTIGENALIASIESGALLRLVSLPKDALIIFEATQSVDDAVAWFDVAGIHLGKVIEYEIYNHQSPKALTTEQLRSVLLLNDEMVVAKLILLTPEQIIELLNISTLLLKELAQKLSADDLSWLAEYSASLTDEQTNVLVKKVLDQPKLLTQIKSNEIRTTLQQSPNIETALEFLVSTPSYLGLWGDFTEVFVTKRVPTSLLWTKYDNSGIIRNFIILLLVLIGLLIFAVVSSFYKIFLPMRQRRQ